MRINEYIYDIPKKLIEKQKMSGWSGDFNIGNYYINEGYKNITPKEKLPVLHWGKAYRHLGKDPVNDWWYKNVNNIRCEPLNDWEKMESAR